MKLGYVAAAAAVLALGVPAGAQAQTKLKFAHVYETNEPYHTEAVWAAQEIAKEAGASGRSIREVVIDRGLMSVERFDQLVSPESVTRLGSPLKKVDS